MDDQKDMNDIYHNSEIYMVTVTLVIMAVVFVWSLCKDMARAFKEQFAQCWSALKDQGTGYSLEDVCKKVDTRGFGRVLEGDLCSSMVPARSRRSAGMCAQSGKIA